MTTAIGIGILLLGLLGAGLMLILTLRSAKSAYHLKCKSCGHTTTIPRQKGDYQCLNCGVPLARVSEEK